MYSGGQGCQYRSRLREILIFLLRESTTMRCRQPFFDLMLTDQLGGTFGPNLMAQTMGDDEQPFDIGLGVSWGMEADR